MTSELALAEQPQAAAWSLDGALLAVALPASVAVFAVVTGPGALAPLAEIPLYFRPKDVALAPAQTCAGSHAVNGGTDDASSLFVPLTGRARGAACPSGRGGSTGWPWPAPTACIWRASSACPATRRAAGRRYSTGGRRGAGPVYPGE